MGYYCTVPQCTSLAGKTKNVKFHRFPRDETMADKWNLILRRGKPYTKYSKVCSLHFTQADYNVTTMGQWKTLSKDAVPSQNLPKLNEDGSVMVIRKSRTVKYREGKKEEAAPMPIEREKIEHERQKIEHERQKIEHERQKWVLPAQHVPLPPNTEPLPLNRPELHDVNLAYRLSSQTLALMGTISPPSQNLSVSSHTKPKKQDAIMQTDPVLSEEDDTQNTSYDTEKPFTDTEYQTPNTYPKDDPKGYDAPKDYTKSEEDFIPQTNEEYNSEAEKYALERKSHNAYEKATSDVYKTIQVDYQPKVDMYPYEKYPNRTDTWYQNGYPDSVELLRNQQHNLQVLQEQHRLSENQDFFNENHIKQEMDINNEEDKFLYERTKKQLDANALMRYEEQRRAQQQRLMDHIQHQVKQEPESGPEHQNVTPGCESVMQPQGSPYYATNGHNVTSGYYEQIPRPGPELLIAKQNALAAHTQLWQNTMKRPFFYSESPHYNSAPLLHRYEDISRVLQ